MNFHTLEPSIISLVLFQTFTILALSLLLARKQRLGDRTRTSIRQWYNQQSTLLTGKIDTIRNSSLQELFALRRQIELHVLEESNTDTIKYHSWIKQMETLHASLNDLLNHLVPPLAEEGLPIAVKAYLEDVKHAREDFDFSVNVSQEWVFKDALSINRAVLSCMQGLEKEYGSSDGISSVRLFFSQVESEKKILIDFECAHSTKYTIHTSILDLCRMASVLSDLKYRVVSEGGKLSLVFYWLTSKNA